MLEAIKNKRFSPKFSIYDDGILVTKIDSKLFHKTHNVELSYKNKTYRIHNAQHDFLKEFYIESDGDIIATAIRPDLFQEVVQIQIDDSEYTLKRKSQFSTNYLIFKDNNQVGTIKVNSFVSRSFSIELPDKLTFPHQIFVFFVFLIVTGIATNIHIRDSLYKVIGYTVLGFIFYFLYKLGYIQNIGYYLEQRNIPWLLIPAIGLFLIISYFTVTLYKHVGTASKLGLFGGVTSTIGLVIMVAVSNTGHIIIFLVIPSLLYLVGKLYERKR